MLKYERGQYRKKVNSHTTEEFRALLIQSKTQLQDFFFKISNSHSQA